MILQLLKIFGLTGLATILLVLWAATILYAFVDADRRRLPSGEQAVWLAVVTLLPLVGFLAYRVGRRLAWQGLSRWRAAPTIERSADTQAMPIQRGVHAPPPPAAGVPRPFTAPPSPESTQPVLTGEPVEDTGLARPVASYRQTWLAAIEGPHAGQLFPLQALPAQIGRGAGTAVRLDNDIGVSRQHAEVYLQDGSLRLRDLNSTHGTYVNGFPVRDIGLTPGDTVQVGSSVLSLRGER